MNQSTILLRLGAVVALVGCADSGAPTNPGTTPLPPTPFILSNPVAAGGGATVAYLSLPPGSFGDPSTATARVASSGASVDVVLVEGGFDPVPLAVVAGEAIEVEVRGDGSGTFRLLVPDSASPVVVRVSPSDHKLAVPVTDSIVVTFSEPISVATLAAAITLRHTGTLLPGNIVPSSDALSATFVPTAPLPPLANQVLRIGTGVRDLDGDSVRVAFQSDFSTDSVPTPPPPPPVVPTAVLSSRAPGDSQPIDYLRFSFFATSAHGLVRLDLEATEESSATPSWAWGISGNINSFLARPTDINASGPAAPLGNVSIELVVFDSLGQSGTSQPVRVTLVEPDTAPRLVVREFWMIEFGSGFWFYAPHLVVAEAAGESGLEIVGFQVLQFSDWPYPFPRAFAYNITIPPGEDVPLIREANGDYELAYFISDGRRIGPEATLRIVYQDLSGRYHATTVTGPVVSGSQPDTFTSRCGRWTDASLRESSLCPASLRLVSPSTALFAQQDSR